MSLTEELIKQRICTLYDIPYPSMIIVETRKSYADDGTETVTTTEVDYSSKVNAMVGGFMDFLHGLKFSTPLPLFGGGIPGPVSGVEAPNTGWIDLV